MALVRTLPVMAYINPSSGDLVAARSADVNGSSWEITTVSADVSANVLPEIASVSGKPAVVFTSAAGVPQFSIYF
ncbi:MAG: hypothetical protein M3R04_01885 [bacterium]|nr:hypothetical protein [bacterium]